MLECLVAAWCFTVDYTLIEKTGTSEKHDQIVFQDEEECRLYQSVFMPLVGKTKAGNEVSVLFNRTGLYTIIVHDVWCTHPGKFR